MSDLIERILEQRPQARVDVVIRLVRATLAHPAWERLPAAEAAGRAERLVLAQLARLPAPRLETSQYSDDSAGSDGSDGSEESDDSRAAEHGVRHRGGTSIDVTDRRRALSR